MSDNENRAVGEEQPKGGYEEQASENTASYVDGEGEGGGLQALAMKKKMSRIKSRTGTKSRTAVNRKNVGDTDRKVQEVEPIVAPAAVTLGHLKDQYYHDLRFMLVPSPPSAQIHRKTEGWSADEKLREMRDAIDEIDRALDGANLSLFGRSCRCPAGNPDHGCCGGGTATADTTLAGCARSAPYCDRRPKPRTGVEMKSYRLRSNDDRV